MNPTDEILAERQKTHGSFTAVAELSQTLRREFRDAPNWAALECSQQEALDMIANKVARALCGDPKHVDHWQDICGYSQLVVRTLEVKQ